MTTTVISDFDDVILFELQKLVNEGKFPSLSFGEIWKSCADAAPNLWHPVDPTEKRKAFVARIFETLQVLTKCEFVNVATNGEDKIESVWLTDNGKLHVSKIIFTNQQRVGKV